jgi:chromosome segregation ATPase
MPDTSCRIWLKLACIAGLAATGTTQNQQLLEDTVRRLEAKLDQIDGYLTGLEPGAEQKTVENAAASSSEKAKLEQRIAELEQRIAQSTAAYEEKLQSSDGEARRAREAAAERERVLMAQLDALKSELEQARLRATEADARTQRDRELLLRGEAEAKTVRDRLDALIAERDRLAKDSHALASELATGRARLAQLEQAIATVESMRQKIEAREKDLTARLDRLEEKANRDQQALRQTYEARLRELGEARERLAAENEELSGHVAESAATIDSLLEGVAALEDQLEQGTDEAEQEAALEDAAGSGIHVHNDRGTVIVQVGAGSIGLRDEALKSSQPEALPARRRAPRASTVTPRPAESSSPARAASPLRTRANERTDEPEPPKPMPEINV